MTSIKRWIAASAVFATSLPALAAVTTFEDLTPGPNGYYAPGATSTFTSGAATFNYEFSDFGGGCCWSGWAYSSKTDTTDGTFNNQYSAFPGSGHNGSSQYGIAYLGGTAPVITFAAPVIVESAYFANTTYAALSMLNGDGFAKKFGGVTGNDPDFFTLTIIGRNAANAMTGSLTVSLADYRSPASVGDFIISSWLKTDLASLGAVSSLHFELASSDSGPFGINTPAYFAMDNLTVAAVPEPGTYAMLAIGLALLAPAARRRR